MTDWERTAGWVFGGDLPSRAEAGGRRYAPNPRSALESIMFELLRSTRPLYVAFSGGRDSALLLAIALMVARKNGLPEPIAVTAVYNGVEGTDETEWQTATLDHLQATNRWHRVKLNGPAEIVDDIAIMQLQRHGVCWPPAMMSTKLRLFRHLPEGAHLIDGEGGDEMLGARRITPVTLAVRRRHLSLEIAGSVALALAPRLVRRHSIGRIIRRRLGVSLPWLRPDAADRVLSGIARDEAAEPLHPGRDTLYLARRRAVTEALHHVGLLGREHGIEVSHPLLDERFVHALIGWGGRGGWSNRSDAIGRIADNLLPREVIMRESKAYFNHAMVGPRAREIAHEWDGSGLDSSLIDVDRLRAEWLSDEPDGSTYAMLQQVALGMSTGGPR